MTNKLISKRIRFDKYVKSILKITEIHIEKNGNRKMGLKELDAVCEI